MEQLITLSANASRMLEGAGSLWRVEKGEVDIFIQTPGNPRDFFCKVPAGGAIADTGWRSKSIVVVGHPGTTVRIIPPGAPVTPADETALREWLLLAGAASEIIPSSNRITLLLRDPAALAAFHQEVQERFSEKLEEKAREESERFHQREEAYRSAAEAALRDIAAVLNPSAGDGVYVRGSDMIISAERVAARLGITIQRPAKMPGDFFEAVSLIAKCSRIRWRRIALEDGWFRMDAGPLVGRTAAGAVALLPSGRGYVACHPDGRTERVHQGNSEDFLPACAMFYRVLPEGRLTFASLLRFVAWKSGRDIRSMLMVSGLAGLLSIVGPFFVLRVFDFVVPLVDRFRMQTIGLALVAAAFGGAAFELVRRVSMVRIWTRAAHDTQAAVWDRLLNLPASFFRKYQAGDLAMRANSVSGFHQALAGTGHAALLSLPCALFNLLMMFSFDWRLASAGLLVVLCTIACVTAAGIGQTALRHRQMELGGRLSATAFELIRGISKIRTAGAENSAFAVWAELFARRRTAAWKAGLFDTAGRTFFSALPVFAMVVIFGFASLQVSGARFLHGSPPFTLGVFIAFNMAFGIVLAATISMGRAFLWFASLAPQFGRLKPILEARPEVTAAYTDPGVLSGEIELSNVRFRYGPDLPLILKGISLHIPPGQFVAVAGTSGSGKSTLMRLLLGLEEPETGTIFYDGHDLQTLEPRALRAQTGAVLQGCQILPGDIFRNIVGETSLTLDDAWRAAGACGLDVDIRALPMGMFTVISDGAAGFSGGQKQRLMIARALVRSPRMVFLDEATSALDNRSQATVIDALCGMNATRIMIAHRLSTAARADRIIVLDEGKIVEDGGYEDLMSARGIFYQLVQRQRI